MHRQGERSGNTAIRKYAGTIYAEEFPEGFCEEAWKHGITPWRIINNNKAPPETIHDIAGRFYNSLKNTAPKQKY